MQVADAIQSFATHLPGLNVLAVYGGSPFLPQQRALARGAQVVVGTPGRVLDHLDRRTLKMDDVRFLVLDEADEMLRMGFAEDVDKVLSAAPRERQVALFSATMPPPIRRVAEQHLEPPGRDHGLAPGVDGDQRPPDVRRRPAPPQDRRARPRARRVRRPTRRSCSSAPVVRPRRSAAR